MILFTLDVGVRRIQIDRDEWLRATRTLRRWLFFWEAAPRAPEAEESLAALLARRDQVRSRQTDRLEDLGLDSHGLLRVLLEIERGLSLASSLNLPDEALESPRSLIDGVVGVVGRS